MKYRGYVIAALAVCALVLGAGLVSCNDADQDQAAPAGASTAARSADDTASRGADDTAAGSADSAAEAPAISEPSDTGEAPAAGEAPAPESPAPPDGTMEPPVESTFVNGEGVYKAANCEMCHGKELQGSRLAPPLAGLAANWDKAKLTAYLTDPEGYTENDPRLKASAGQYSLPMPAWKQTGLVEADMQLLIDWLLARE